MGRECWGRGGKCAKLFAEVIFRKLREITKILTTAGTKGRDFGGFPDSQILTSGKWKNKVGTEISFWFNFFKHSGNVHFSWGENAGAAEANALSFSLRHVCARFGKSQDSLPFCIGFPIKTSKKRSKNHEKSDFETSKNAKNIAKIWFLKKHFFFVQSSGVEILRLAHSFGLCGCWGCSEVAHFMVFRTNLAVLPSPKFYSSGNIL